MTINIPSLKDMAQWAHSLVPILGLLMFAFGAITQAISQYDPSLSVKYSMQITLVGGILTTVSKLIDSANNAISPGAASIGATPKPPA